MVTRSWYNTIANIYFPILFGCLSRNFLIYPFPVRLPRGRRQRGTLTQWRVALGKIKLFLIFGELNANIIVCLVDELFNILLSYYCHGIHTPPRCDIGEVFIGSSAFSTGQTRFKAKQSQIKIPLPLKHLLSTLLDYSFPVICRLKQPVLR